MKVKAFMFTILYLASVVGYGLEFHYCLGEITNVNYVLLDTSCHCDDAHEGLVKGCCEEKEFFVQIDQDHQTPSGYAAFNPQITLLTVLNWNDLELQHEERALTYAFIDRGPPVYQDRVVQYLSFQHYG